MVSVKSDLDEFRVFGAYWAITRAFFRKPPPNHFRWVFEEKMLRSCSGLHKVFSCYIKVTRNLGNTSALLEDVYEAKTFENPDFLLKITVFENITRAFSMLNLHFQRNWHFFSEGVGTSGFFKKKIESGKFMGKLTDFENIVSARRNSRSSDFPLNFCGYAVRTFPRREICSIPGFFEKTCADT